MTRKPEFLAAALADEPTPIPVRSVASDEFAPIPQTSRQKEVAARLNAMADDLGGRRGLSRRRFFQTASGMAAGFLAMNQVYGELFEVSAAEASEPEVAAARADALSGQFVMDVHTHFLRDDTKLMGFLNLRKMQGQIDPRIAGREPVIEDLKFPTWFKEVYLDSDTKVALISNAPSEEPGNWFLTNEAAARARDRVNREAGSRRCLAHAVFTPGQPGWLEQVDRAIELKPDSWKGYTLGDVLDPAGTKMPWRMDDEKLVYPFYEKAQKAGINTVCVHKGLMPPGLEQRSPEHVQYFNVDDVPKAAKDWPGINFVIYHSAYRFVGGKRGAEVAWRSFERSGRLDWVSDLAEIPAKHGVKNVWGDLGQVFAQTIVLDPRVAAAMLGVLVRGLGAEKVVWGTDAIWSGSPQWQIEGLRRLEIPEDLRRRYGFAPLGSADGPVKAAILGRNSARMYAYPVKAAGLENDRVAALKRLYLAKGADPSLKRYGWIAGGDGALADAREA